MRSPLLLVLAAACGVTGCSTAPVSNGPHRTAAVLTSRPTAVVPVTPAPVSSLPMSSDAFCAPLEVRVSDLDGSGAAEHMLTTLVLSTAADGCYVFAHPGLQMYDRQGAAISTHAGQGGYADGDEPEPLVSIPPDSTRFVVLSYTYQDADTGVACTPTAAFLDVTLGPRTTVRIAAPTSDGAPMHPCDGDIAESPVGHTAVVFGTDP